MNIDNEQLNPLEQEKNFSNTLDFLSIENISSTDQHKLDQFCINILSRIHDNVRCFIPEKEQVRLYICVYDTANVKQNRKKKLVTATG